MNAYNKIKTFINDNKDKKIAMFVDMDGTIASLDVDINGDIGSNKPGIFLDKRPLKTVINMLEEISNIENVDLYILSACGYKAQAEDKRTWLAKHAPFFEKEKQIFVVKEIENYTKETKPKIKTGYILDTLQIKGYDLAIYYEDELSMLKKAYDELKDKILLIHISEFID